jgi:hypothetical protein
MVRAQSVPKNPVQGQNLRVCPFCGVMNHKPGLACPRCTLEDTPEARSATKVRIGPWYVLQSRNPAAPGMKFQTLQLLIRKGFVTPQSVVRSPTTNQLWQSAAKVKGLSREFGLCYSCGGEMSNAELLCPHCNRSQALPTEVDALLDQATPTAEVSIDDPKPVVEGAESAEASDVLSPRELAMVFQLGYDAPGAITPPPVREESRGSYYIAATVVLVVTTAIGLLIWRSRSITPARPVVEPPAATPKLQIHLEPVVVPPPNPPPANVKVIAPTLPAINPDDVPALWNKALDAESHRDFADAIKLYQSIQAMPSEIWPAGLPTRIKLAQQELSAGQY